MNARRLAAGPTRASRFASGWTHLPSRWLPVADATSAALPFGRLVRLSLFQVSVGMATALTIGTLNRVMIVELGVHAWVVATMVALPLLFAPFRALVGFRSDTHVSALGWRRVPYLMIGTLLQFGGLAIMPFALIILSGDTHGPAIVGPIAAALAFLMVGAGMQIVQTAGLALATDLATPATRPRVVAALYVMLLVGLIGAGAAFGWLLADFGQIRLIQVVQGAAVLTLVLNVVAAWRQEPRDTARTRAPDSPPDFLRAWRGFMAQPQSRRFLLSVGLGTAAFNMQDIVLEPYGGEVLHLSVGQTAQLTAVLAGGALAAYLLAARVLGRGGDAYRVAAAGIVVGLFAFAAVLLAAPLDSPTLFRLGGLAIGFGGGLFAVGTLAGAMQREHAATDGSANGLALGAWGAVQATAAGLAIAAGGLVSDAFGALAARGSLGPALSDPTVGYGFVYQFEILLLFLTLAVIGPLVRHRGAPAAGPRAAPDHYREPVRLGLADLPR
ncbi:MAG: BCD family MFS transporter [Pseudomonadota bacterium]